MTERWNLITTKKTSEQPMTTLKQEKEKMIYMEEEKSSQHTQPEKLYERKKRNFTELDSKASIKQSQSNPIKLVPYSRGKLLQIKNTDNISNFTEPTLSTKHVKSESKFNKNESNKIFAYESIEKFMIMDERLVDQDRAIGHGVTTTGNILSIFIINI